MSAARSAALEAAFEKRPYLRFAFANPYNLSLFLGTLAAGPTIVLISGGLDLSIGSIFVLIAVVIGLLLNAHAPVAVVVVLSLAVGAPRQIVEILTPVDLSGYVVAWDQVAQKVRIFTGAAAQSPLAEINAAADLHLTTLRLRVLSQ